MQQLYLVLQISLHPRAIKGVFLGYPFQKKGFKILNLETMQVFLSRDVRFYETIFPFKELSSPTIEQLFPQSTSYSECDPLYTVVTTEVSSASETLPPVSTRPARTRVLPARFEDYTGLPAHLANSIFVPCEFSASSMKSCPLDAYIASLSVQFSNLQFVANAVPLPEPTSYK